MITFFDYCFYRIATTRYFQKVDPKMPWIWAFGWVSFCQTGNVLTLIDVYQIFTNSTYNYESWIWPIAIFISIINMFLLTEKKYNRLVEHYKEEKNKKIKGWGVFLYVLGSLFIYIYIGVKFFWVPVSG